MKKSTLTYLTIISTLLVCCKNDTTSNSPSPKQRANRTETLIAYNVLVDPSTDNYDIFVTDLEGEYHNNIANYNWLDWVYSSYQNRLYVISDRDTCSRCYFLYETDSKGSYWNKISDTQLQDSWVDTRYDGTEIIVKPVGKSNTPFHVIDRNGTLIREINTQMDYSNDPCFSPDGNSIVYRGYNGDLSKINESELYLYNLKTTSSSKITSYPTDGNLFGHLQYYANPPRWNNRTNEISYSTSFNNNSIIKSIDLIKKTNNPITHKNIKAVWHDISDNGQWLTYDGQLNFKADSNTTQIFLMDFEKRSTKKLTKGSGYKQGPVFVYSQ